MSKHTAGPWFIEGWLPGLGMDRGAFTIRANTPDGEVVITGRSEWDHRAEASRANARLIAAAPELLEALKECLPHIAGWDLDLGPRVRSAISKAKGRE